MPVLLAMRDHTTFDRRLADRLRRPALALLCAVWASACSSDMTQPEPISNTVSASIQGPESISGAVINLRGVSDVSLQGGQAFNVLTGDTLRSILVLRRPGTMQLTLTRTGPVAAISGTVVEVTDRNFIALTSVGSFRIIIER